jgi:hypothetical protein
LAISAGFTILKTQKYIYTIFILSTLGSFIAWNFEENEFWIDIF